MIWIYLKILLNENGIQGNVGQAVVLMRLFFPIHSLCCDAYTLPPLVLDVVTWLVWTNGMWRDETWPSALLKHQYKVTGGLWPLMFLCWSVRWEWPTQRLSSSQDSKWKNCRCSTQAHNSGIRRRSVILSSLVQQRLIQNHFCLRIL